MRPVLPRGFIPILCVPLWLAGCGSDESKPVTKQDDPAVTAALGEPITTDPDLSGMNRANSVASLPTQDGSLPTIEDGPQALAAARADALRLVGGSGKMRKAPEPAESTASLPPDAVLTAAARAAAAPGGEPNCAARAEYTMAWAARLPAAFPVFPRGAVQEAAGTDAAGCSLRVVNFVTPVPLGEVMDFYFTRAQAAGFSADHVLQDGDNVLAGTRATASYVVYARRMPSGNTEVDLVTNDR